MLRTRDFVVEHADRIAKVISEETGKTLVDALSTEVLAVAMGVNYYAKHAETILKRKHLRAGSLLTINKRSYVDHVPFGVVGIISPWNYPFSIPFQEVATALMAGNGVVLKVASQTLRVGGLIREAVEAGGFPDGLFHLMNLPGVVAGDAFMEAGVSKLCFIGSGAVGRELMGKAAERLIPVSLELDGNDAMIVCADANLHRAVEGALWAGLSNSGQSCAGAERIFVEKPVYDEFIALLKKRLGMLRQGVDEDCTVDIGSMTTEAQVKKMDALLRDAVKHGATTYQPHRRSRSKRGFFHAPVILTGVNDSMLIMRREVFGPLLGVAPVATIDEAVERTNNSALGLTASVWTRDRRKAHAIAARLEVGSVTINDHLMSHGLPETPWGGPKESGIGRSHGYIGLEQMTHPRVVVDDILPGVQKNMWWYPHDRSVYDGLKGALDFLYGPGLGRRLSGLVRTTKTFMRTFSRGE
jgi:succinate-semialdehyde dehydrogenase/glutarate-semialdehyde dehydrogenase